MIVKLTETQRKHLTELIGECWHDIIPYTLNDKVFCQKCKVEFHPWNAIDQAHRTFATHDDFFAVVRAMDSSDLEHLMQYELYAKGITTQDIVKCIRQQDFIEKFMLEVCKMGGVE